MIKCVVTEKKICANVCMKNAKAVLHEKHIFTAQFYYGFGTSYYGFADGKFYGYNAPTTKEGRLKVNVT